MDYTRKTYVEFENHVDDEVFSVVEEVRDRNVSKVIVPETAISFKFFDRLCAVIEDSGEQIELKSEQLNPSPRYYYGGRLFTQDEIAWHSDVLFSVIAEQQQPVSQVIQLRSGGFRPFLTEEDIFIEETE